MQRIKFITDSASDITTELAEKYSIDVLAVPVSANGEGFMEGDISRDEFYQLMDRSPEIPTTAYVIPSVFQEHYKKAYEEGYTHIITSTICSTGSGMFNSATMAKSLFFEETPEAKGKIEIVVLDSKSYTLGLGYPVLKGCELYQNGIQFNEIVDFMQDAFNRLEIHFTALNLKYVKKSGRVSCAAAFVGDVLGLKPVIELIGGNSRVTEKIRGEKNIAPRLTQRYVEGQFGDNKDYILLYGDDDTIAKELGNSITAKTGIKPYGYFQIGASIAINAGYQVAAVVFLGVKK